MILLLNHPRVQPKTIHIMYGYFKSLGATNERIIQGASIKKKIKLNLFNIIFFYKHFFIIY